MQHRLVGDCDERRTGNGAAQETTVDGREKKKKDKKREKHKLKIIHRFHTSCSPRTPEIKSRSTADTLINILL